MPAEVSELELPACRCIAGGPYGQWCSAARITRGWRGSPPREARAASGGVGVAGEREDLGMVDELSVTAAPTTSSEKHFPGAVSTEPNS